MVYEADPSTKKAPFDPDWKAKKLAAIAKKRKANKRAAAKTVRKGKQAKRKASRSPGGYQGGGYTDPTDQPTQEQKDKWAARNAEKRKAAAIRNEESRKRTAASKRAKAAKVRTGTQAKRQASRSPGGFAGGGAIESYSAQVQRKYGGGKI